MYISAMANPLNPTEMILGDGTYVMNVHADILCEGQPCAIHHPSKHAMGEWAQRWRDDGQFFDRLCEHGIGHPDPDDVSFHASQGRDIGVHTCDGCCS